MNELLAAEETAVNVAICNHRAHRSAPQPVCALACLCIKVETGADVKNDPVIEYGNSRHEMACIFLTEMLEKFT